MEGRVDTRVSGSRPSVTQEFVGERYRFYDQLSMKTSRPYCRPTDLGCGVSLNQLARDVGSYEPGSTRNQHGPRSILLRYTLNNRHVVNLINN
jgi:hypothetical protein